MQKSQTEESLLNKSEKFRDSEIENKSINFRAGVHIT